MIDACNCAGAVKVPGGGGIFHHPDDWPGASDAPAKRGYYWALMWDLHHCMEHGWVGYRPGKYWQIAYWDPENATYVAMFGNDGGLKRGRIRLWGPHIPEPPLCTWDGANGYCVGPCDCGS